MDSFLRRFVNPSCKSVLYGFCTFVLVLLLSHPTTPWVARAIAQSSNPAQLVQSGVDAYQKGDYLAAITNWNEALAAYEPDAIAEQALVNENLARAYQKKGDTAAALGYWETAAARYKAADNRQQFGRMLSEQAQVYVSRGQHQRAAALLCGAAPKVEKTADGVLAQICEGGAYLIAQEAADPIGQAVALGSLAEASRLNGQYETAQALLEAGVELVQTENLKQYAAPMLNSLGSLNVQQSQIALRRADSIGLLRVNESIADRLRQDANQQAEAAAEYFNKAIVAATENDSLADELSAQLNRLLLAQQQNKPSALSPTRQRLRQLISQINPSRETTYAAITLAKSYQSDRDFSCRTYQESPIQESWLEESRRLSNKIEDTRAESFALGELGHIEECNGNLEEAIYLTNQAGLAASGTLESADSLYLWEWQMGRLHKKQGDRVAAMADYKRAIATLETIRADILTADRELQFDFRDTVDPVYRQYISLQLEDFGNSESASIDSALSQADLTGSAQAIVVPGAAIKQTLKTIDALRLAELQNFFGDDCVLTASTDAQTELLEKDPQTTIISSIVLPNRVALIANFPDGTSQTIQIKTIEEIKQTANDYRRNLRRYRDPVYDQTHAQALYQQLISPFESALASTRTETIVFIQDGFLRNIPMSALYNGNQYLIERYAVATTPALSLTATKAIKQGTRRAIAMGISQQATTENGRVFAALEFVPAELMSVSEQLPGSKVLLDRNFTTENLSAALLESSYSILHLATHGQFSTIPEETFVLTGSDQSGTAGELTFGELEVLIRAVSASAEPVDLITLTACETATGDDRATLGLAGVAIRAGARSAIASLWKVDDAAATQLIGQLYGNLRQPTLSKAKALQRAQIAAIEADSTANPGSWAPLILVGNWQ